MVNYFASFVDVVPNSSISAMERDDGGKEGGYYDTPDETGGER